MIPWNVYIFDEFEMHTFDQGLMTYIVQVSCDCFKLEKICQNEF